jgi:hypothetical protein
MARAGGALDRGPVAAGARQAHVDARPCDALYPLDGSPGLAHQRAGIVRAEHEQKAHDAVLADLQVAHLPRFDDVLPGFGMPDPREGVEGIALQLLYVGHALLGDGVNRWFLPLPPWIRRRPAAWRNRPPSHGGRSDVAAPATRPRLQARG